MLHHLSLVPPRQIRSFVLSGGYMCTLAWGYVSTVVCAIIPNNCAHIPNLLSILGSNVADPDLYDAGCSGVMGRSVGHCEGRLRQKFYAVVGV